MQNKYFIFIFVFLNCPHINPGQPWGNKPLIIYIDQDRKIPVPHVYQPCYECRQHIRTFRQNL